LLNFATDPGPRRKHDFARVIVDTDIGSDCDDAGALAVLHALADLGEVQILACIYSSEKNRYGPGCISAINRYYGRGNIPIGASSEDEVGDPRNDYLEKIAKNYACNSNNAMFCEDFLDIVSVYRQALSSAPDNSVTIVTIGHTKGLYSLLRSAPCSFSALTGIRLVDRKVKRWVAMAGEFPFESRPGWNFGMNGASKYSMPLVSEWPRPIVFAGFEVGNDVLTGRSLLRTPAENPVREAYRLWGNAIEERRPSWDQIAILFAVRGCQDFWKLNEGFCRVDECGCTIWEPQIGGPHAYLVRKVSPEHIEAQIDSLMAAPPFHCPRSSSP